jgi:hypothetical protein
MKRLLILATAAVLVLGLTAATYAEVEWGASGFVRVRSAWHMNAVDPTLTDLGTLTINPAFDDTQAWMDTRFRLKFSAKANDYATGVIYFEGDSSQWGEDPDGRNTAGAWNADRNAVELKQFYIDFKVPGLSDVAPTKVRAGIQGFSVRSHILLYADGPGVEVNATAGPVKFNLYWYKPNEGDTWRADDADIYGVQAWIPGLLPVTPGFYFLFMNSNEYPIRGEDANAFFEGPVDALDIWGTSGDSAEFWWAGAYVDGKIGPVTLKADFAYMDGEVDLSSANAAATGFPDPEFSGWAAFIDACYTIQMEMPIDIGGTFAYGSGDDLTDVDTKLEFDGFRVPVGSEEPYGGNWGMVFYPSAIHDGVYIANRADDSEVALGKLGGTWFAKLYASVKPLDWLKITAYGMYIGDTTKDGNTIGRAIDPNEPLWLEDESDIGIEVGAYANIQIYKNLTYSFGGGYLFAGDALDTFDPEGSVAAGTPVNESPDDPWAILSQLIFKF